MPTYLDFLLRIEGKSSGHRIKILKKRIRE